MAFPFVDKCVGGSCMCVVWSLVNICNTRVFRLVCYEVLYKVLYSGNEMHMAVCPTLTLNEQWPAVWQPGWMALGSDGFTCHPHVYPQMELAILHLFHKHSPDGIAWARWHTSGSAYYSSIDPKRMKGWVGLVAWPYSAWFTHISGHPSATGRAWDRESSPVKDQRSTTQSATMQCSQLFWGGNDVWQAAECFRDRKKYSRRNFVSSYPVYFYFTVQVTPLKRTLASSS